MTRLTRTSFASCCALAIALAYPAAADEYADSVDDFDIDAPLACCGDPNDALGAPDASGNSQANFDGFVTITDVDPDVDGPDFVQLDYDDNLCILSGDAAPDLTVHEYLGGASETFDVRVGLQGGLLSGVVSGSGAANMLDFDGVAGALFNRARIVSTNNAGAAPGADIDAVECLYTLDVFDIQKEFWEFSETDIDVGVDYPQFGYSFIITITNNTGINGGLAGLTFFDSVPAEFDLDPYAEDAFGGVPNNQVCIDTVCDGVDESAIGDCDLTIDTSEGAKKKGRSKLEPEHIILTADNLAAGDSCSVQVFVQTDNKDFVRRGGPSPSPDYTPTSCPEDPGVIVLNDGVRVFDASMNLLLEDDDMLTLECNNFTD